MSLKLIQWHTYQPLHQFCLFLRVRLALVALQYPGPSRTVAGLGHAVRVDQLTIVGLNGIPVFTPPVI